MNFSYANNNQENLASSSMEIRALAGISPIEKPAPARVASPPTAGNDNRQPMQGAIRVARFQQLERLSQRWGIDFWVAYKKKDGTWTKWYLLSEWPFDYPPNYRQVLPAELIMESDLTEPENKVIAEQICTSAREKGIGFYCDFTGNKSYHVHSFWNGLADLLPEQRTRAKEFLVEWLAEAHAGVIDKANHKPKRLILIHGARHPKTDKPKTLFKSFQPERINETPAEILAKAQEVKTAPAPEGYTFAPSACPFIDYACKNRLQVSQRNINLVPNVVALTQDHQVWQACADAQGKKLLEFENWAKRKPNFSCSQLRRYAESIGKGNICTTHLLEVMK